MGQVIKNAFIYTISSISLYAAQVGIVYLLFYPFNQINVPLQFLIWKIIYKNNLKYLWVLLLFYILSDLFSTLSFGVAAISAAIAILVSRRIFNLFITTYAWYTIFLLGLSVFLIYNFSVFFMVYVIPLIQGEAVNYNISGLYSSLLETGLNAAILLVYYGIYTILRPKKRNYYAIQ